MAPRRTTRSTADQESINTTSVTNAQLQAMIDQGVTASLAARDALGSTNGDDSHNSETGVRRTERSNPECTYTDFLKCQPLPFKGTEGVDNLSQWCERIESVFHISNCAAENQVKFATCTLHSVALTWCNTHVQTDGHEAAYGMTWKTLMKMMTKKYCPRNKIRKLEMELWDLKVKGTDLASYIQRYLEFALLCRRMFFEESDKIEKYIGGLPDMIHGSVVASKPKTMQEAIEIATELMDKKIRTFAERETASKRKFENTSRNTKNQQQQSNKRKTLAEFMPQHLVKRSNMGDLNPYALNAIITTTVHVLLSQKTACYECGVQGHFRRECPKLKNDNNHGNQGGRNNASARVYAVGRAGTDPDANVVTTRMEYEKPSTKLTFYKPFFLAQWKFLIHRILQCMSAKRIVWNEFSSFMASAVICLATEDEDDVNEVFDEPTSPSPTPTTPLPPPQQEHIPLPPQAENAQPSPLPQHQPLQSTKISMTLLNTLLEICATLTKQVANLEQDKVGTAQIVESSVDTIMDDQEDASKRGGGGIAELDADKDVTLVDAKKDINANVQGRLEESQAKLMTELITTATTTITVAQVSKANSPRRRGVIIQDPEEVATASVIVQSKVKSKDKGKGIIVEDPKPLKRQAKIEHYEAFARELRAAMKQRIDKETEGHKTHLQIVPNDKDDVYTEAIPLALKVPVIDYKIHHEHNKPFYKIIRADGTHQLFLSFITLLRNFDIEDLEMLWKLVQEIFQSLEPKKFSDDFLLNTFTIMFEKLNVEASI
nr:hypothetical protein [Tanacetum cinerariifolium]